MAMNVLYNHTREAKKMSLLCSLSDPLGRTSKLLGIPATTLVRWRDETNASRPRDICKKFLLDSFDMDIISRCLEKMFNDRDFVTLKKLKAKLHDDHDLNVTLSTLWRSVKSCGFQFKRSQSKSR